MKETSFVSGGGNFLKKLRIFDTSLKLCKMSHAVVTTLEERKSVELKSI